jgi:heat shock protein HtpX
MRRALADTLYAAPFATAGTALWILIAYKFHQSMLDAVTGGREVTRQQAPGLYKPAGESLHLARDHHADTEADRG